ncbi:hypothetical protein [Pseudomonas frederiksbergensis]|uniref:IPT/TIG domain-containing protein n=1 Tax=Pseudomonas frederiksbergensis TaxID=104087 RepID=A0A6L5C211_9PSED|nr:hypothetical protein [Pseudomonas frederiksbergensis]KAF2394658.1 hypothetical protein FX983_02639 [Pseudomonas frederiksbergensis]
MARGNDETNVLNAADQPNVDDATRKSRRASGLQVKALGLGLIVFALVLSYMLVVLWPAHVPTSGVDAAPQDICFVFKTCFSVPVEARLIMLVMAAGGLGSFVHTATSFGDFVGNEKLTSNWMWWYILKPFIGMALAIILYMTLRAGLLTTSSDAGNVNFYGVAALASMAGMFSKQATDKLSEVFDTLFKTSVGGGDAKRKDDLESPVPGLSSITPVQVISKSGDTVVVLKGTGFIKGSVIKVNGNNRRTDYIDATQLSVCLLADELAKQGELLLTVFNPAPGGGLSAPLRLSIVEAPAVLPATTTAINDDGHDELDGCDGQCLSSTHDEDLPPSMGGVAS